MLCGGDGKCQLPHKSKLYPEDTVLFTLLSKSVPGDNHNVRIISYHNHKL
jgi:hypothetical protein